MESLMNSSVTVKAAVGGINCLTSGGIRYRILSPKQPCSFLKWPKPISGKGSEDKT